MGQSRAAKRSANNKKRKSELREIMGSDGQNLANSHRDDPLKPRSKKGLKKLGTRTSVNSVELDTPSSHVLNFEDSDEDPLSESDSDCSTPAVMDNLCAESSELRTATWVLDELATDSLEVLAAGKAFEEMKDVYNMGRLEKTKIGSMVSSAMVSILIGLVASNMGIIPPAYSIVTKFLLPLTISLLLFRADMQSYIGGEIRELPELHFLMILKEVELRFLTILMNEIMIELVLYFGVSFVYVNVKISR